MCGIMDENYHVQKIKESLSKWLKTKDPSIEKFSWQDGYVSISVSTRDVNKVAPCIENQHDHHQKHLSKKN